MCYLYFFFIFPVKKSLSANVITYLPMWHKPNVIHSNIITKEIHKYFFLFFCTMFNNLKSVGDGGWGWMLSWMYSNKMVNKCKVRQKFTLFYFVCPCFHFLLIYERWKLPGDKTILSVNDLYFQIWWKIKYIKKKWQMFRFLNTQLLFVYYYHWLKEWERWMKSIPHFLSNCMLLHYQKKCIFSI